MQISPKGMKILLNLFLLYISWGSTYICLKLCMHACGPFTLCGVRMLCGGLLLALLLILTGRWRRPVWADMRHAAWLAIFMVLMASGFLAAQEMADYTMARVQPGDLILTLGGGDVYKCANLIVEKYRKRQ